MARIPLVNADSMSPEQKRAHDEIVALNHRVGRLPGPYWLLLHSPELAEKISQVGELLRYRTSLEPRLSELAILITARHCDAQYEWYAHATTAQKAGIADGVIEAIRLGRRPELDKPDEAALYDYVSELNATHHVSDAVYDRALEHFGKAGLVELTTLSGYYNMVAFTLNAHDYDRFGIPAGTPLQLPALK
jgi:4-carboxymuconolactone decarboxylase